MVGLIMNFEDIMAVYGLGAGGITSIDGASVDATQTNVVADGKVVASHAGNVLDNVLAPKPEPGQSFDV